MGLKKGATTMSLKLLFPDDLSYRIGDTVELFGEVTKPVLKEEAVAP